MELVVLEVTFDYYIFNNSFFISYLIPASVCLSSATNPCRFGSTCIASNDDDVIYTCSCANGCSGKNCDTNCNCLAGGTFGCQNSGSCQSGTCSCPSGYSGIYCQNCKKFK